MILPDDIESYSLVCWQIHLLGTQIIMEHRRLRRQLTSVGNSISTLASEPKGTTYMEIFQLLELILANPIRTLYIKNLVINRWHRGFETEQVYKTRSNGYRLHSDLARDEGPWFKSYPENTLRIFEQTIRELSFADVKVQQAWISCVKLGHEGPLLLVLLTMLSKLQNITIHRAGGDFRAVFENIGRMLNSSKCEMLPALRSVELSETLVIGYSDASRVFFHKSPVKHLSL